MVPMVATPLHILLHGLMVLVPASSPDGANRMAVLLVAAREKPPGAECVSSYRPLLRTTTPSAECIDAGCKKSGAMCACDLTRKAVLILAKAEPAKPFPGKGPSKGLPFDTEEAGSFSYVPNLARPPWSAKLDPRLFSGSPPSSLVARMEFIFESVTACDLSGRRDGESNQIHPVDLRPLKSGATEGTSSQPLARGAIASLTILEGSGVTLKISDLDGSNAHQLKLATGAKGYVVEISNEPEGLKAKDDPCDDGVDRDFAFLYNLFENPPAWSDRLIPHVKLTQDTGAAAPENPECVLYHELVNGPKQPLSSFKP
jgi:hypothetical protein